MDKGNAITTDFLVIGGGVAGLRSAIELSRFGDVLVITKDRLMESSSDYAQGGVAVALSDEDRLVLHLEDTLRAGDGLCRKEAVRILVEEGLERIMELISWGAEFDRKGGTLSFTREGGHSISRVIHARGDATGEEIVKTLLQKTREASNITMVDFNFTVDLIIHDKICRGAIVLDERKNIFFPIYSKSVILATGGAGQVYARTTNPAMSTGDGVAIAYRAGAVLEDLEFIQFHPTTLHHPAAPPFLLSEAMRGEGAVLRNMKGERFMPDYHPLSELAPRDIVSRAILNEMNKTGFHTVFLDLTHLPASFVKERFPRIHATCLRYGMDITEQMIPVSPAAHFIMGGVKTDLKGATDISGLYAAGEVACTGVHGANRLASNALLEGLVFGARVGRAAGRYAKQISVTIPHVAWDISPFAPIEENIGEIKSTLCKIMWEKVGIIREGAILSEALKELSSIENYLDRSFSTRLELEVKNMACVARVIAASALERRGSVGAHYRIDFPSRGKNWRRHITQNKK